MRNNSRDWAAWVAAPVVLALLVLGTLTIIGCSADQPSAGRPVLYVFTLPGCEPCIQDYEVVEQIAGMGLVTVRVVNGAADLDTPQQWGVAKYPTYIYWQGGHERWRCYQAEIARRAIIRDNL